MKLKELLNFSTIFLLLFLFLGYLEAGPLGIPTGFLFWAINSLLMPFSLIPFAGFFIYKLTSDCLLSNIAKFIPVPTLFEKAWLVFGIQALLYNITSSIVLLAVVLLFLYYWRKHKQTRLRELGSTFEIFYKELLSLNWSNLRTLLSKLFTRLKEAVGNLDKDLIGSCLFWLGLGVASHDFYWETHEEKVHVERMTHGVFIGLGIASTGINLIETNLFRNSFFYLGQGSCYLGFYTLSFLPKGPSRLVSHFFWWAGISLMIYNWYKLMEDKLLKGEIQVKKVGEILNVNS